jgi:hypothetical protein
LKNILEFGILIAILILTMIGKSVLEDLFETKKNEFGETISVKINGFEIILINEGFFKFLEAINNDLFRNRDKKNEKN